MGFSQIKIDFSQNKIKDKRKLVKTQIQAKIAKFEQIILREKSRHQEMMVCHLDSQLVDIWWPLVISKSFSEILKIMFILKIWTQKVPS